MVVERCAECGFDGSTWSDSEAVAAIAGLPDRWADALAGLSAAELTRRSIADMWSIAEYCDHVREVLFGMRFLLDTALAEPGTDLGPAPEPRFDPQPRAIDVDRALAGLRREATSLAERLVELPAEAWTSDVALGDDPVDVHWIARHAVHDPTHHLDDVTRLRTALGPTREP